LGPQKPTVFAGMDFWEIEMLPKTSFLMPQIFQIYAVKTEVLRDFAGINYDFYFFFLYNILQLTKRLKFFVFN
jgi:hypothetical protein